MIRRSKMKSSQPIKPLHPSRSKKKHQSIKNENVPLKLQFKTQKIIQKSQISVPYNRPLRTKNLTAINQNLRIRPVVQRKQLKIHSTIINSEMPLHPRDQFKPEESISYYKDDIKRIMLEEDSEKVESSIEFNHINVGIYASKFFYPLESEGKKNQQNSSGYLPSFRNKIVLLFDLDETLVHTLSSNICDFYDEKEEIYVEGNGEIKTYFVNIRPYSKQILHNLSKYHEFELGVFTASEKEYADKIIKILDPEDKIFSLRYYRHHCENTEKYFTKNLSALKYLSLTHTVLIDNSPFSYLHQPENAIPVLPFLYEKDDDQLKKLEQFLIKHIYDKNKLRSFDVRKILKSYFKLAQFRRFKGPKELIKQLYS